MSGALSYAFLLMLSFAAAFAPAASARADAPPAATHQNGFAYIALKPLTITRAHVQTLVTVTLEVPEDHEGEVETLRTRLTDTFQSQLTSLSSDEQVVQGAGVDAEHMKIFLMTAAIKVAGPGRVHDMHLDIQETRS